MEYSSNKRSTKRDTTSQIVVLIVIYLFKSIDDNRVEGVVRNGFQTRNHLFRKQTLNHLAKPWRY